MNVEVNNSGLSDSEIKAVFNDVFPEPQKVPDQLKEIIIQLAPQLVSMQDNFLVTLVGGLVLPQANVHFFDYQDSDEARIDDVELEELKSQLEQAPSLPESNVSLLKEKVQTKKDAIALKQQLSGISLAGVKRYNLLGSSSDKLYITIPFRFGNQSYNGIFGEPENTIGTISTDIQERYPSGNIYLGVDINPVSKRIERIIIHGNHKGIVIDPITLEPRLGSEGEAGVQYYIYFSPETALTNQYLTHPSPEETSELIEQGHDGYILEFTNGPLKNSRIVTSITSLGKITINGVSEYAYFANEKLVRSEER